MQRTLAVELQRLSIQFRKQQKAYLNRLRSKDGGAGGSGAGLKLLDDGRRGEEEYDPGFSDMQASGPRRPAGRKRGEQRADCALPTAAGAGNFRTTCSADSFVGLRCYQCVVVWP